MLDQPEFSRWLEAADDEARVAHDLVTTGAFNATVLHAEQAAQLALKGLLRGVGAAREAWGHSISQLADRAAEVAGLAIGDELAGRLAVLERDYKPSRYPDALVSGTPRGNYTREDTDRALQTCAEVRDVVVEAWAALTDAAGGSHDDG
ncbi:MAG: HEPN domain-containing protein [Actinomycetota bacterium]|nr:HEPN domain-containing protein [Actinomycetota bacterium]